MENLSIVAAEKALHKRNVAAIIIEPIQSEGGNSMFRQEYFQKLRNLADDYEALLIFDEVQTGFGASGKWWCHEHYAVQPDLMAFGKKSQVCGVAATNRLNNIPDHCFATSGRINSTWGGNIVDMVLAEIIIDIIEKENLVQRVDNVGAYFKDKLHEIEDQFVSVSNVRGLGTLLAFDLPHMDARDELMKKLREDMLILGCGEKSVRFRPALTFETEDVDHAIRMIRKALK